MLRLFDRWARSPRRGIPRARLALRLESLEARANPAAPVLSGVSADWGENNVVVISGVIQDETPSSAHVEVAGAAVGDFTVNERGQFTVLLKGDGPGSIYFRAADNDGLYSAAMTLGREQRIITPVGDHPSLRDVEIIQDGSGDWHIRGHVDGSSPIGTIIKIINGPSDSSGQTGEVNSDGSFDIIINTPPDSQGGGISIIAVDPDGNESDTWDGILG
jgi:hypothetical protein